MNFELRRYFGCEIFTKRREKTQQQMKDEIKYSRYANKVNINLSCWLKIWFGRYFNLSFFIFLWFMKKKVERRKRARMRERQSVEVSRKGRERGREEKER